MERLSLLALSGSLRKGSFNTEALRALTILAPDSLSIVVETLGVLPLFNPDREEEHIDSVIRFKMILKEADGLIIASPEYAHGISGVMKNALDWLVSGDEFIDKPIMLINTSPRATHAQIALKEVLTTMSGYLVKESHVSIPLLGSNMDAESIASHPDIAAQLANGLVAFSREITSKSIF